VREEITVILQYYPVLGVTGIERDMVTATVKERRIDSYACRNWTHRYRVTE
jgi:hypothetical protein